MDLNNEMIFMRKHFKNAKVFVVRKLIRHIRNLKHKKGSEKQLELNKKRIAKLGDEISVIQNLVSDIVFKYLLTSNSTLEDLSKQINVSLHERACVRIGLVPFIRKRMKDIRQRVNKFNKLRSNKDEITSLKIVEKLQSKCKVVTAVSSSNKEESIAHGDYFKLSLSMEQRLLPSGTKRTLLSDNGGDASKSENLIRDDENDTDTLSIQQSDVNFNAEEQSIEVVLPIAYNKTNDASHKKQLCQIPSNFLESKAVTEIFENAGEGYAYSDEEEAAIKRRRLANFESNEDDFFVSDSAHGRNDTRSWKKRIVNNERTSFKKGREFQKKTFRGESRHVAEHSRRRWLKPSLPATEHLHPSWLASKKKKEQNRIIKFTGTRITFSDSD